MEDRYAFAGGILVSRAGMAKNDDQTRLFSALCALCALMNRLWTEDRSLLAHYMPSVKARSARKAARDEAEGRVVRGGAECGFSSFSASEGSRQGEEMERSEIVGEEKSISYAVVKDDGSRRSGRLEPNIGLIFARRAEILSDSASFGRVRGGVTYSKKKRSCCGDRDHQPSDMAECF